MGYLSLSTFYQFMGQVNNNGQGYFDSILLKPNIISMGNRNSKQQKLLIEAFKNGDNETIMKLVQKYPLTKNPKTKRNLLHEVCSSTKLAQEDILNVTGILLRNDVDCNSQDSQGNTPMHYCGLNCYRNVARMLALEGGHKSVFVKNKAGQVPADMVNIGPVQDPDDKMEISHVFLQLQMAATMDQDED